MTPFGDMYISVGFLFRLAFFFLFFFGQRRETFLWPFKARGKFTTHLAYLTDKRNQLYQNNQLIDIKNKLTN